MSELANLWLFIYAIAKTSMLTGLAPGLAIAFVYTQVSGRAVSRVLATVALESEGNKPVRNFPLEKAA